MDKGLAVKSKQKKKKIGESGITLIALVITIVVLLILARGYNCNAYRAKWNTK